MTTITVRIADYAAAAKHAMLVTNGLGSCVGIALYDASASVGALAHILLPNVHLSVISSSPGKCASTAVPAMVRRMRELGATGEIEARLIGGASMFAPLLPPRSISIGSRNVAAAHAACAAANIPVVAEDVGGVHGRSVYFDVAEGDVVVRSMMRDDVRL